MNLAAPLFLVYFTVIGLFIVLRKGINHRRGLNAMRHFAICVKEQAGDKGQGVDP